MHSLLKPATAEIVVKGSRFIAFAEKVESAAEVKPLLGRLKDQFPDASHYCYAYVIGESGEIQKASDDKEPSKTAGLPILEILKKNSLTDVLLVVIRYFGGVKLGAGGLIRAYSLAARTVVDKLSPVKKRHLDMYEITVSYSHSQQMERYLLEVATIIQSTYTDKVGFIVECDHDLVSLLLAQTNEITNGTAQTKLMSSRQSY